jgi:hypothetical protein
MRCEQCLENCERHRGIWECPNCGWAQGDEEAPVVL